MAAFSILSIIPLVIWIAIIIMCIVIYYKCYQALTIYINKNQYYLKHQNNKDHMNKQDMDASNTHINTDYSKYQNPANTTIDN